MLGPHVVGQRVVVRRLLRGETGPTGGPAMTDLLGTCLSWSGGTCVVQPDAGPAVTIALADIVSGKPVPPRPSTRLRVGAREAELHTAALFPTVEVVPLGEWRLRVDTAPRGRRLKRANSCLAMGDPGAPVVDALAQVESHYAGRDVEPLLQVEAGSALEAEVGAARWHDIGYGESELLLASVARVRRSLRMPAGLHLALDGSGTQALARVLDGSSQEVVLAEGRAGRDGDWVGLHAVAVDAGHRRTGLATAVVATLLEWAAEQGAMTAWLHVETDNPGGGAFWEALGFAPHHRCRYYAPPSSASASPVSR